MIIPAIRPTIIPTIIDPLSPYGDSSFYPSSLRPYIPFWHDGSKRSNVYYGLPAKNLADVTWATSLTGWISDYDSIVSNKYRLTRTSDATGSRFITSLIDKTKYYLITVYGTSNSDTDGAGFILIPNINANKNSSTLTKTQSSQIGIIIQPSDISLSTTFRLDFSNKGNGYAEYYQFFIQEITSDEYAEGLVTLMARYPYYDLDSIFGTGNTPTYAELMDIYAQDGATASWTGTRSVLCNPAGKYFWYDYSGNNRHMYLGNLGYVAGSTLSANGFEVDGADDFGSIPDSAATRLTGGGTLMAWIYPKGLGEESTGRIIDKSTSLTAANGYYMGVRTNNVLAFVINNGTLVASNSNGITLNKWQLACVTFNNTGRHIFVNAVDVTSTGGTETALPPDVAGVVVIGNRAGATDRTFDGYIDKVPMFTRALTLAEIKDIYNRNCRHYGLPKI